MKYYYGNSYKEAISNTPIEINDTKILEAYKENYSNVFLAEDQDDFYSLVTVDIDGQENDERYNDVDDARADFLYCTQEVQDYVRVVLRHVVIDCFGDETIDEIEDWSKEDK